MLTANAIAKFFAFVITIVMIGPAIGKASMVRNLKFPDVGLYAQNVVPHGFGWAKGRSGKKYGGPFHNGKRTGQVKTSWPDGRVSVGDYRAGIYTGDWLRDQHHGFGMKSLARGSVLEGPFKTGKLMGAQQLSAKVIQKTSVEDPFVYQTWQGEYPSPIVRVKKTTRVSGYKDYRDKSPSGQCTLVGGKSYHPWARKVEAAYVTLVPVSKHQARKAYRVQSEEPLVIPTGGMVAELGYGGEGFCLLQYGSKRFTDICPWMDELKPYFKVVYKSKRESSQFFSAKCKEGSTMWIKVDKELFKHKEIQEDSSMTQYGAIAE